MRNLLLLFIILMAILISGCSREIDSGELEYEPAVEPPVPISSTVTYLADAVKLNWQVSDTLAGINFGVYYIDSVEYYSQFADSDRNFILWEKTDQFSSTITSLNSETTYLVLISSILADGLEGKLSTPNKVKVGVISMLMNNGDKFTNNRNVNVSFLLPRAVSLIQLSEDSSFVDSYWQIFSTSMSYELSAEEGAKSLYSRFKFTDGSQTDSAGAFTDSIILDSKTLIDSVYFSWPDSVFAKGDTIMFSLAVSEKGDEAVISFPGVNRVELEYNETASNPASSIYIYSFDYVIPYNIEVVDGFVTGRFTDEAGNSADDLTAQAYLNIANDPEAVNLNAVALSSSSIRLEWSQNIDNDFSAYQLYRDTNAVVSNTTEPITIINTRSANSYIDSELPDDSVRYYYQMYVYDNTGRSSGSNIADAVTLFNDSPVSVELLGQLKVQESDTTVSVTWTKNEDPDFKSYRVYRHSDSVTADFNLWHLLGIFDSQSIAQYTDELPDSTESYYQVEVLDKQGKRSMSNWVEILF